MTRHGTLAYYLAAWVIGCFIVSLLGWVLSAFAHGQPVAASVLLMDYFFALVFGAADMLLFAFLLRRMMRWWGTSSPLLWLFAGAAISFLLILLLARADRAWAGVDNPMGGSVGVFLNALLMAPAALRNAGFWQVPIEGGATAAVLSLVNRAFDRPDTAAEAQASAAKAATAKGATA